MLSSIPFICIILLAIYQNLYLNSEQDSEIIDCLLMFYGVFFVVGLALVITVTISYNSFNNRLSIFSKNTLERIGNDPKKVFNTKKLLITDDVIIFFGFFKKQVIDTNTIKKVQKNEGTHKASGIYGVSVDYKTIILTCSDNTQEMIVLPKNYGQDKYNECIGIIKDIIKNK